ncbi:hypothetical protein [Novosphingobium gossypii]|uniref:hypothetical protein n=1 Tax=Novosphingobium gossypii TaxID=1604774 RepID=UPI003D249306
MALLEQTPCLPRNSKSRTSIGQIYSCQIGQRTDSNSTAQISSETLRTGVAAVPPPSFSDTYLKESMSIGHSFNESTILSRTHFAAVSGILVIVSLPAIALLVVKMMTSYLAGH